MSTTIRKAAFPAVSGSSVEIVERKGKGHPDSICDALSEEFSRTLCRYYLKQFDRVYHHNVDKAILVGGASSPQFGGGEVDTPVRLTVVGRVTLDIRGDAIPAESLFLECARDWLQKNVRHLDLDSHIELQAEIRPGSDDLVELYERTWESPLANDTSFGVGYWPLSPVERAVLAIENHLNADAYLSANPWLGEDIKVMGVRVGEKVSITVATAMVDSAIGSLEQYRDAVQTIHDEARSVAEEAADGSVEVFVNAADDYESGAVYLTVTGTSAEAGDDGEVGRGNRSNGLITPYRPMSLEAPAGKNPVSHVGKTYNILAEEAAREIVEGIDEVKEAYVFLVSRIGAPVSEPQAADVQLRLDKELTPGIRQEALSILGGKLAEAPTVWRRIVDGAITVF